MIDVKLKDGKVNVLVRDTCHPAVTSITNDIKLKVPTTSIAISTQPSTLSFLNAYLS